MTTVIQIVVNQARAKRVYVLDTQISHGLYIGRGVFVTPTLALGIVAGITAIFFFALWIGYATYYGRRARRFGYASRRAYLTAVPKSDEEKREAVDQALKGLVISIVGIVFFPLLFIGLFPLYIGCRKSAYALMGLGLFDNSDSSRG